MTLEEWAIGEDTGTSSLTIYCAVKGLRRKDLDIPHDPDDFGRCWRFLKLFPEFRSELHKTVEICPRWKPFVENWDELEKLYEAEKDKYMAPNLYARMKELRGPRP